MPASLKRSCIEECCRELTARTRCEQHRRIEQRRIDAKRGSPVQRGYDAAYRAVRQRVLEAYGWRCAYCGGGPRRDDPIQVDHVVALARGGTNDP